MVDLLLLNRGGPALAAWLQQAQRSWAASMRGLAAGLQEDREAALADVWPGHLDLLKLRYAC